MNNNDHHDIDYVVEKVIGFSKSIHWKDDQVNNENWEINGSIKHKRLHQLRYEYPDEEVLLTFDEPVTVYIDPGNLIGHFLHISVIQVLVLIFISEGIVSNWYLRFLDQTFLHFLLKDLDHVNFEFLLGGKLHFILEKTVLGVSHKIEAEDQKFK